MSEEKKTSQGHAAPTSQATNGIGTPSPHWKTVSVYKGHELSNTVGIYKPAKP
ncbi:hypothetical protein L8V01_02780 [Corynebacterium sp. c8Ua_181]|uniref:Uncharacterized protein n=1 Tax=Corynebacterium curieae TaxID=2913500 RepID=A0A9X3RSW0_9CORY|nr:hypothetical protein [Corynebacterium curieae]MCZ9306411.1 hypothetical protein [Corynebacterium curieae]MDV2424020.1 hypothetical protein [Corynebacterium curieae]